MLLLDDHPRQGERGNEKKEEEEESENITVQTHAEQSTFTVFTVYILPKATVTEPCMHREVRDLILRLVLTCNLEISFSFSSVLA